MSWQTFELSALVFILNLRAGYWTFSVMDILHVFPKERHCVHCTNISFNYQCDLCERETFWLTSSNFGKWQNLLSLKFWWNFRNLTWIWSWNCRILSWTYFRVWKNVRNSGYLEILTNFVRISFLQNFIENAEEILTDRILQNFRIWIKKIAESKNLD